MSVQKWEQPAALSMLSRDVVDGWAHQVAAVAALANRIAGTEFVPKGYRGSDAAVTAAILTGREIGVGPMTALAHLPVIDGRPAMTAQLMRALVFAAGHSIRIVNSDGASCTLAGQRRGEPTASQVTWTMSDARQAGLVGKRNWQNYPRQMLLSRATAELCRAIFPDVIGGMAYTVEEVEDMTPADAAAPDAAPTRTVRRRNTTPRPAAVRAPSSTDAAPEDQDGGPDPAPPPTPSSPSEVGGVLPPLPEDEAATIPRTAPDATESDEQAAPAPVPPDEGHKPLTPAQRGIIFELLGTVGVSIPRATRLHVVSGLVGRRLASLNQLTRREASALIDTLALVRDSLDPGALDALVAKGWERIGGTEVDAPTVGAGDIERDQLALWDDDEEEAPEDDAH